MPPTAADLEEAFGSLLRGLADLFEREELRWMLVGGLAVGVWTEPRGTKDIDLALSLPESTSAMQAGLDALGLASFRGRLDACVEGGVVRLQQRDAGAPPLVVDLLCAGTDFEHEALGRRRGAEVFGARAWVASPDDLFMYKLIAGRPQDMADADRLIRVAGVPQDTALVERLVASWQVEERYQRALRAARR